MAEGITPKEAVQKSPEQGKSVGKVEKPLTGEQIRGREHGKEILEKTISDRRFFVAAAGEYPDHLIETVPNEKDSGTDRKQSGIKEPVNEIAGTTKPIETKPRGVVTSEVVQKPLEKESGTEEVPGEKAKDKTVVRRILEAPERVKSIGKIFLEKLKGGAAEYVKNLGPYEGEAYSYESGKSMEWKIGALLGAVGTGAAIYTGGASIPAEIIATAALSTGTFVLGERMRQLQLKKELGGEKSDEGINKTVNDINSKLDHFLHNYDKGKKRLERFLFGISAGIAYGGLAGMAIESTANDIANNKHESEQISQLLNQSEGIPPEPPDINKIFPPGKSY